MNAPVAFRGDLIALSDLERMAKSIAQSGLFGMKEPTQALALMLVAQAEGLHPATIAQEYDIIQGKACRKTHSVLARFQAAGGTVKWEKLTDDAAIATFSHPAGGSVTIDWTIERAKKTMVWDSKKDAYVPLAERPMYKNGYPRAMLRSRCIAEGVRAVYPGAIGGMLVPEEAQDSEEKVIEGEVVKPVVEGPRPKSEPATTPASEPAASQAAAEAQPAGDAGPDGNPLTEGAKSTLKKTMERAGRTEADLTAAGFPKVEAMKFGKFNDVMKWLKEHPAV